MREICPKCVSFANQLYSEDKSVRFACLCMWAWDDP